MVGSGKIVGIVLAVIGLAAAVIGTLWLAAGQAAESITSAAMILGLGLLYVIVVLPLVGFGIFMFMKGGAEQSEMAKLQKERRLLDIVTTKGKAQVTEIALELNMSKNDVRNAVYDLVGKELFVGYVDWKAGTLYSAEVAQLSTGKCPNCGAQRDIAGKGIVKCNYCGAETFLPRT